MFGEDEQKYSALGLTERCTTVKNLVVSYFVWNVHTHWVLAIRHAFSSTWYNGWEISFSLTTPCYMNEAHSSLSNYLEVRHHPLGLRGPFQVNTVPFYVSFRYNSNSHACRCVYHSQCSPWCSSQFSAIFRGKWHRNRSVENQHEIIFDFYQKRSWENYKSLIPSLWEKRVFERSTERPPIEITCFTRKLKDRQEESVCRETLVVVTSLTAWLPRSDGYRDKKRAFPELWFHFRGTSLGPQACDETTTCQMSQAVWSTTGTHDQGAKTLPIIVGPQTDEWVCSAFCFRDTQLTIRSTIVNFGDLLVHELHSTLRHWC